MTGNVVNAAVTPGRCAAPPAPQIRTRRPRSRAVLTYCSRSRGVRCAEMTFASDAMPKSCSASAAAFITGQSESLPIKIPTRIWLALLMFLQVVRQYLAAAPPRTCGYKCSALFWESKTSAKLQTLRFIAGFLALRRNTSLLLVALVLAGTGEKLWLGFAPKYLETLGAGVFLIGLFDALQTWLGAVYAYPGGWFTDHWGQRRSLILFNAISLAGYVLVLLWQHPAALLVGSFLFLAWSALSLPTTFSVVATSLQRHQHTMGIGVQSMVRRVPMMLGPLIGGWLVTKFGWGDGVKYALVLCIVLSGLTMLFQWLMLEPEG